MIVNYLLYMQLILQQKEDQAVQFCISSTYLGFDDGYMSVLSSLFDLYQCSKNQWQTRGMVIGQDWWRALFLRSCLKLFVSCLNDEKCSINGFLMSFQQQSEKFFSLVLHFKKQVIKQFAASRLVPSQALGCVLLLLNFCLPLFRTVIRTLIHIRDLICACAYS